MNLQTYTQTNDRQVTVNPLFIQAISKGVAHGGADISMVSGEIIQVQIPYDVAVANWNKAMGEMR